MSTEEKRIFQYAKQLLSFMDDLLIIADKRFICDKKNYKKLFLYFCLLEIKNSFRIILILIRSQSHSVKYFTQISVIARHIYEIFLTLFWVTQEELEEIYFAYSSIEDYEFTKIYLEISKDSKKSPLNIQAIQEEQRKNIAQFKVLIKKSKKQEKDILQDKTMLGPSKIANILQKKSKDPFFKTMNIGHKSYYTILCLASHFRPSSTTSNVPHIADTKSIETARRVVIKVTIRILLMVIEKEVNKLAYKNTLKNRLKHLISAYDKTFENYL